MLPTKDANIDTLPKLLQNNYHKWGDGRIALRHKDYGIWQEFTWKDYYQNVKLFALGLKSLGFKAGDKICIIGDNEPEWYWAELAAQSLGGIAIGVFVDCVPDEVKYIVDHSEAVFAVVRDQEQVDKLIQIQDELPNLRRVVYWDDRGMWSYDSDLLSSFEEIQELGSQHDQEHPNAFEQDLAKGKGEDLAIFCYTSGTTGLPKGAMISHWNLLTTVHQWFQVDAWKPEDNYLSYVPPAWVVEQMFGITGSMVSGAVVNFPERPETLQNDVREIGPSMILYSSRLWESLCATIQTKIEDGTYIKRLLFKLCLPIGYKATDLRMEGEEPGGLLRMAYSVADALVFRSLRDKIGLKNTRSPYTGGSLISPGSFRFFRAIGVDLREAYGSSEAGLCCCQFHGDVKYESIGVPLPGMELRISDQGEMLWKGDCIFQGYYKEPEKTAKALDGGWYHSGDAGHIDEDGHIIYLDRMADMMDLGEGVRYSPQHIEGSLKFSPYIRDVIAVGGGRFDYVVALVQIDFDSVGKWAERQHIAFTTFASLSQKPEVYDLVESEVRNLNRTIPADTQVRKFVCLHKELDPDEEELTRTRKLKREFLEKKYGDLLDAAWEDKDSFSAKSVVKYRDGGMGETSTEVKIKTLF